MTSSTGAEEHPDVVEISALADGLLAPPRSAELRRHLDSCSLCDDVRISLDEIRSLLGTLPGPVRMPVDVEERIDAALAAEALLDARSASRTRTVSRETVRTEKRPGVAEKTTATTAATDAPKPVSRETSTAKGGGRSIRRPGSPSRPDAGSRPSPRGAHRPRRLFLIAGTATAAVLVAAFLVHGLLGPTAKDTATRGTRPETTTGAQGLTPAGVESQVHRLLASSGPETRSSTHTDSSSLSPLRSGTVALPSCVRTAIDRPELPLAAAPETYAGRAAYLVVLPHPSKPGRVSAYVVARSCISSSAKAGEILYKGSFTRD